MLLPRTLFGRNALLILGLIAVAELSAGLAYRELVQRPRAIQLADIAADFVSGVLSELEALPSEERQRFLERLSHSKSTWIVPVGQRTPDTMRATNSLWRQYARDVAERLHKGPEEVIWSSDFEGSLWIRERIAKDQYWVILPRLSAGRPFSVVAAALSGLILVLALAGALLIQRRINRPLRRLVGAARQLALGRGLSDLPEEPPEEIAMVTRAFNHMAASLERIDQERNVMLAGVSHDLRTPLSKVRLAVEIMEARIEPEMLTSLRRSLSEINLIIDQFMDYGRASTGDLFDLVNVNELIKESVALREWLPGTLDLSLLPVPSLRAQRLSLIRAISNLLENAVRHGDVPILVCTEFDDETVRICVRDCGPGIPEDEIESMKQPFRRGGSTRAGSAGSGLGLAIVERIARVHGGELRLSNPDAGGLEARIDLPIR